MRKHLSKLLLVAFSFALVGFSFSPRTLVPNGPKVPPIEMLSSNRIEPNGPKVPPIELLSPGRIVPFGPKVPPIEFL